MNNTVEELLKAILHINTILEKKALTIEEEKEEASNFDDLVRTQKQLDELLQKLDYLSLKNDDEFTEALLELHLLAAGLQWYFDNTSENIRKIIKAYTTMKKDLSKVDADDIAELSQFDCLKSGMTVINKKSYVFDKDNEVYLIAATKNYVVTNWGYKGVSILSKELDHIVDFFIQEHLVPERIYAHFEADIIALCCPEDAAIVIVNLATKSIEKIYAPDSLDLEDNTLSALYYWKQDRFIIRSSQGDFFNIDLFNKTISAFDGDQINLKAPDFWLYFKDIESLLGSAGAITFFPNNFQVTYYDSSSGELVFIDSANKLKHVTHYRNDDIHGIYFINDFFIVIRCDTIQKIDKSGVEILMRAEDACEYRQSMFDSFSNNVFIMSRYWRARDVKMTLYALSFAAQAG